MNRAPLRHRADSPPRVLIAGGGVAAVETMLALREVAEERVTMDLLTPRAEFVYRPMAVAEIFDVGEEHRFDLVRVCADQGAGLRSGSLAAVDAERRVAITGEGDEIEYDALVVASGAQPHEGVPGALTFAGKRDVAAVRGLLDAACTSTSGIDRIAFVAPAGLTWALPLYELALMSSARLAEAGRGDVELVVVSPEDRPLGMFGSLAGEAVCELLAGRGIEHVGRRYPTAFENGELSLVPDGTVAADVAIALPNLQGPRIPGLECDELGFIRTDRRGAVPGAEDVYAVGDCSDFPVKQGGVASQQADAVADLLAARAGAELDPKPFVPVLRGVLLTGGRPLYMRAEISGGHGDSAVSNSPLWWPASKVAGRHLSPYLALHPRLRGSAALV